MASKANDVQVGGNHYKDGNHEEHWDRVNRLGLDYFQACITKYVERCWKKNGVEDLKKAQHFLTKYIELKTPYQPGDLSESLDKAIRRGEIDWTATQQGNDLAKAIRRGDFAYEETQAAAAKIDSAFVHGSDKSAEFFKIADEENRKMDGPLPELKERIEKRIQELKDARDRIIANPTGMVPHVTDDEKNKAWLHSITLYPCVKPSGWVGYVYEGTDHEGAMFRCKKCFEHLRTLHYASPHEAHDTKCTGVRKAAEPDPDPVHNVEPTSAYVNQDGPIA